MIEGMVSASSLNEGLVRNHLTEPTIRVLTGLSVVECVTSTNDEVMRLKPGADGQFVACIANQQSNGRGRNGRKWQSPAGANIYMSVGFTVSQIGACKINGLSLVCGVAVARCIQGLGAIPLIKWPNDIFVDGKKLAGILIETRIKADNIHVVIGIGMNVKMPDEASLEIDQPWIDLDRLLSLGNAKIERNQLAAGLLNSVIGSVVEYARSGLASFAKDWEKFDMLSGREVTVLTGEEELIASVLGVDENFALRVKVDSEERLLYAADVKLKL